MLALIVGRLVSPTFVARGEGLAAAEEMLRRIVSGHASHMLVAGEAGIGKTRFGEAVADLARPLDVEVLPGGCMGLGSGELPFAPVAEILRGLVRDTDPVTMQALAGDDAANLARIAPGLGRADGGSAGDAEHGTGTDRSAAPDSPGGASLRAFSAS